MIHIIPLNDIKEHIECSTCECNPILKIENGEIIFIHNRYVTNDSKKFLKYIGYATNKTTS